MNLQDEVKHMRKIQNITRTKGIALVSVGLLLSAASLSLSPIASQPLEAAAPAPSIAGYWLTDKRDSIVQIGNCGPRNICGLIRSYKGTGKETDAGNPDRAKRMQPICNLKIIGNLVSTSSGWSSGWIYDPESGDKYQLSITLSGANKIKLRAYQGIEAIGESFVWTRSAKVPKGCLDV
jgi:uncharacterized protein (DUF2147 family)